MPISLLRSNPETLSNAPLIGRSEEVEDAADHWAEVITMYPLPANEPIRSEFPVTATAESATDTTSTSSELDDNLSAQQMADMARREILRHAA